MSKPRYSGTLNDGDIKDFCNKKILISEGFNESNISQACYELRASEVYYDLEVPSKEINLSKDKFDYILIKPKQSIVIITYETLKLPDYIIGRILTKGKLFSIGLLPVNTYADPGFEGKLGIVLHNTSINYLKISPLDAIAKIEFSALKKSVLNPYKGQHGFQTGIWPIPYKYVVEQSELENDSRIDDVASEIIRTYGKNYSGVINRLLNIEKKLVIAAIFYFTFSLLLIGVLVILDEEDFLKPIYAVFLGVVTNLISFFVLYKIDKK